MLAFSGQEVGDVMGPLKNCPGTQWAPKKFGESPFALKSLGKAHLHMHNDRFKGLKL